LWLGRDNQLIDVPPGGPEPAAADLLPLMPDDEVARLKRWSPAELAARAVKPAQRDWRRATLDSVLPGHGWELAPVIGWGLSQHRDHRPAVSDPQGFSVEWLRVPPGQRSAPFVLDRTAVLVHAQGPLAVDMGASAGVDGVRAELGPWDTVSLPAGTPRSFVNTGTDVAEALLIVQGDAPKPPRFDPAVHAAAALQDATLDAGGHLARKSLLPPAMAV
jgi:mannose-6-phosphate isomerase-like protein (cupin superfamily)